MRILVTSRSDYILLLTPMMRLSTKVILSLIANLIFAVGIKMEIKIPTDYPNVIPDVNLNSLKGVRRSRF